MSLDAEDRQWISDVPVMNMTALEGRLDQRFDQKLVALEDRIDKKLVAMEGRIDKKLLTLEGHVEERFNEKLEDMETRLLTASQKWPSPVEIRQRADVARIQALELDMYDLKERVEKLEGKRAS